MIDVFLQSVDWPKVVAALSVVAAIAYVASQMAARLVRTAFVAVGSGDEAVSFRSPIVRRPIRIVRATVFLAVFAVLLVPALDLSGVNIAQGLSSAALTAWLLGSGLRIVVISIITYLLVRVIAAGARRLEDEISHAAAPDQMEQLKRARTLGRLVRNGLTAAVVAIASLMVLRELRMDIMPILTGAGIAGLAVGFGAQTLVKDLIAGFFLTLENHVRVGDVAMINGTGGLVEAINLRTIVLRDLEGVIHVFPNGSIERLANRTKDFAFFVLDVGVAYKEDTDQVAAVLRDVGAELAADPAYGGNILAALEILGVDAFEDSQVVIKIRIKTLPLKQWEVGRELRRRIKKTFDARGIEIPFPHRSIYFGEASKPFLTRRADDVQATG